MSVQVTSLEVREGSQELAARARELGPALAARAASLDEGDAFVAEAYAELKAAGLLEAGVPVELGGGGAGLADLCAMLRELAQHCSSTALAFAMHTHLVATAAWRWRVQHAPVEGLLRRVAAERLVLLSTGGADWLEGSGTARPAEGGYVVDARKSFVSGAPAGDLLLTTAVLDDPGAGPTILHFPVSMRAQGVRVEPTWRAHGMRATGSHDVVLESVFVPAASVGIRRPRGRWDPALYVVAMVALPLIYAVYLGVAEAAREVALRLARRRPPGGPLLATLGELEDELRVARLAHADMVAAGEWSSPGVDTTCRVLQGRSLVGRATRAVLDLAMEVGGGRAYFRDAGLERLLRDVQASRYHPVPDAAQREFAARVALGLPVDG